MLNLLVGKAQAQQPLPADLVVPQPTAGFTGNFGELIATLINWAIALGALVCLIFILIGGFNYVTAGDDSGKAEGARGTITNAVIGLIIIASAFVIFRLLAGLLNVGDVFGL